MNLSVSFQQHGGKTQKKHTHQHGESGNRTNTNPFPSSVLDFLTEQFHEGKQFTTLNSYHSALSATLHHIDGRQVGQHPTICCL